MRIISFTLFYFSLAGVIGCGGATNESPAATPLTVEQWNGMPPQGKYTAESYERLKLGEPKFQDEKVWDKFYRSTVLPGQRKEKPKH